ncbi:MAG TPA: flippase-like domain-containing protein [Candidatus Altiarchaeales archaeon]|nr:flippase-like domain-containing protein [Candidatus Altiarchaeales archaeon]
MPHIKYIRDILYIMVKNKIKRILPLIVGIIILAYIPIILDTEKILELLFRIKIEYFLLATVFYFLIEITVAIILRISIEGAGKISIISLLLSHMCGMLYGYATPGRVGYYYVAFSLGKKLKISRSEIIGILTVFQGLNFFIKIILCMIAVAYFSTYLISDESKLYLILVSLSPIIAVIGVILSLYTDIANRIFSRISFLRFIVEYIERMQRSSRTLSKEKILKMAFLVFFGWFLMSAQFLFIAFSLNIVNIDYINALMLQPLLTTITFVPISPAGLGVAEGGSSILFKIIGLTLENGVAFMLLVRFNSIIVDSIGLIDMRTYRRSNVS